MSKDREHTARDDIRSIVPYNDDLLIFDGDDIHILRGDPIMEDPTRLDRHRATPLHAALWVVALAVIAAWVVLW